MNEFSVTATPKWQIGYLLMIALTCLVYLNSFHASWHFDDYSNIVYNQKLHINDFSVSSIIDSLHASPWFKGEVYRPVACLSFALNWYLHQDKVFGYHLVNLLIHCLAAVMLMNTVMLLFRTPLLHGRYPSSNAAYWIALLSATLWAIHPIQTQAVTYIVQRMASLAGMFYIAGLFCFLKGRLHDKRLSAYLWYVGVGLAYLLAIGSKENAAILPLALILMEVALFRPNLFSTPRRRLVMATAISATVLVGVVAVLLVSEETMNALLNSYAHRYFNHSERLLTQFRILVFYIFQIVYPSSAHLSLDHYVVVSTGIFTPWTTLPAMLSILGILWASLYFLPKVPLLGFGGLFFLLQHSVESSFLPLELIFEHRNYIPSMFLFPGFAAGVYRLLCHYSSRNPLLHRFLVLGSALMLCFVAIGTYSRNDDWRTEKSLWEDALKKAPQSSRAYHNLAWSYYERIGDDATAIALYKQAIRVQSHRKGSVGTAFLNIGNINYRRGDYYEAIRNYMQSLAQNPSNPNTHLRLIQSYMAISDWDQAQKAIRGFLPLGKRLGQLYRLQGLVFLSKHRPDKALEWFRKARQYNGGGRWMDMAGIGQSLHLLGHYIKGDFFLRTAQAMAPDEPFLLLNRLVLYLDAGQGEKAAAVADQFVLMVPAGNINTLMQNLNRDASYYPIDYQRIHSLIVAALQRSIKGFANNDALVALKHS